MESKNHERNGYDNLNGSFRALEMKDPTYQRTAVVLPVRRHQQIAGKSVAHKDKLQSSDRYQNMTITLGLHESFMSSLGNLSFEGSVDFDNSGTMDLEERSRRIRPADVRSSTETKSEAILEIDCKASESSDTARGFPSEETCPLSPTKRRTCQKLPRVVDTEGNINVSPSRNTKLKELVTHRRAYSGFDAACSTPTNRPESTPIGLGMNKPRPIRRTPSDIPGSGAKTPPSGALFRKAYSRNHGSCRTPLPRQSTFALHKSPLRRSRSEFPSPMSSRQGCNDSCLTPSSRTQSTTRHSSLSDLELRHGLQSPRRTTSDFQGFSPCTRSSHDESSADERIALENQESEMLRYALNLSLSEK